MDLWTWGSQPTSDQLKDCLHILCQEQKRLCGDAAGTTLYSYRFRQRAAILKRYYIAQCRNQSYKTTEKVPQDQDNSDENVRKLSKVESNIPKETGGSQGLARLGSRAALSFAFAFLRRAWRSGEDSDLCTELLQETLEALVLLPPASLFDQSNVSSVWMEVVERTSKFLRSVVMGDLSSDPGAVEIPSKDRNTALTLLLEFAIQKGSLHEMLDMVRLLLTLWTLGRERQDNRSGCAGKNAIFS